MKENQTYKTVHETGKLPAIIADGLVFNQMTKPERSELYKSIQEAIEQAENANSELKTLDFKRAQSLYKRMLGDPENRLNKAFLVNKFKDEMKWHFFVFILENALYEHLLSSLEAYEELHKHYKIELHKSQLRINQMQTNINKYEPKNPDACQQ